MNVEKIKNKEENCHQSIIIMGCCGKGDKTDVVEMSSHSKEDDEKPVGEYGIQILK